MPVYNFVHRIDRRVLYSGEADCLVQAAEDAAAAGALRGALLCSANLKGGDFAGRDLQGIVCHRSNCRGGDFRKARCSGGLFKDTDFTHANLDGALFRGASLSRARFRGAFAQAAAFEGADLRHADFTKADLRHTRFLGADLLGVKLEGARLNWKSRWLVAAALLGATEGCPDRLAVVALVRDGPGPWALYLENVGPGTSWAAHVLARFVAPGDDAPTPVLKASPRREPATA